MNLRLSGWKRLGIVASVLWVIGAGGITYRNALKAATEEFSVAYNGCMEFTKDPLTNKPADTSKCLKEGLETQQYYFQNSLVNVALIALVPIPVGWLLAYMFRGVWRWVRRGFVKEPEKIET